MCKCTRTDNLAEAKYGTSAWDDHYSKLNGDAELTWGPDPLLTPLGCAQAADARELWRVERQYGVPVPEVHFLSPLRRALDTWKITFLSLEDPGRCTDEADLRGVILENCREEYGIHTCDLRSPRAILASAYPSPTFSFEDGFPENDPLWLSDVRETKAHIVERAMSVLDRAFLEDATCMSGFFVSWKA
ncbi:hypothetical protein EIP86_010231 [Pleurotus ostreatoroseus]|nr:hypothetical protein EIP86_010231 [Pleurotus ostreatoroseus]